MLGFELPVDEAPSFGFAIQMTNDQFRACRISVVERDAAFHLEVDAWTEQGMFYAEHHFMSFLNIASYGVLPRTLDLDGHLAKSDLEHVRVFRCRSGRGRSRTGSSAENAGRTTWILFHAHDGTLAKASKACKQSERLVRLPIFRSAFNAVDQIRNQHFLAFGDTTIGKQSQARLHR
ncbi:hypothetical protein D0A36_18510 [Xanthomonas campestris]|nr:hypothetical protein D0A41_18685 [Xanthomonas campestris]RFF55711.1 hypothetical protein D0A36_18510 [Xanthomonas campestris]